MLRIRKHSIIGVRSSFADLDDPGVVRSVHPSAEGIRNKKTGLSPELLARMHWRIRELGDTGER